MKFGEYYCAFDMIEFWFGVDEYRWVAANPASAFMFDKNPFYSSILHGGKKQ